MKYLICKKNFKRLGFTIFKEGEKYKFVFDNTYKPRIFVYYDEFSSDPMRRGYTFYEKEEKNSFLISDYFCNLQELRKIKIQKLNEI